MIGLVLSLALTQPLADAQKLPKDVCYRTRYFRVTSPDEVKGASLLLNTWSTARRIKTPVFIPGAGLVRFDALDYVRNEKDLKRFLSAWEDFKFDPAFNELRIVSEKVIRNSLHDPLLVELLATEAPVVDFQYANARGTTTIKAQGGNADIFGGRYYELADIPDTEVGLYKSVGIDFGDKSVLEYFDELPSELRTGTLISGVSGKKRRTDGRPTEAAFSGMIFRTLDVADGKQDGKSDPFESLLVLRAVASEIIYTRPNGLHGFALYDGAGKRQDVAPPDVVKADSYVNRSGQRIPHAAQLQGSYTCLACHWSNDDSTGLITLRNDVLEQAKRGLVPTDRRVLDLYQGDPKVGELFNVFDRARLDLKQAVLRTTAVDGVPHGWGEDQQKIVRTAGSFIVSSVHGYFHEPVDVRDALRELGVKPPEALGDAMLLFHKMVPPTLDVGEGLPLSQLRLGFEVSRFDWSLSRSDALRRLRK